MKFAEAGVNFNDLSLAAEEQPAPNAEAIAADA